MNDEELCDLADSPTYEAAFGFKFFARMKRALAVLLVAACLLYAAIIYFRANYVNIIVYGISMEETLSDGDSVLLKLGQEMERGDIVVIDGGKYNKLFSEKFIIKRVIAIEGDELYCEDGTIYLKKSGESDFSPLKEDYVSSKTPSFSTVKVGEGEFFFLGDNRAVSRDSSEVGCLPVSSIYGRVPSWAVSIKGFTSFLYGR